ncbi:MAG: hypothetical protein GY756_11870 [bacterium]|nr:hypothetical protein [bacterium]
MQKLVMSVLIQTMFVIFSLCICMAGENIFFEDFSSYTDGELPAGWIGGDNLAVREINRKKVLKDFVNGSYDVTTKKIDFPEKFMLTINMKHHVYNQYKKRGPKDRYYDDYRGNSFIIYFGAYQVRIGDSELCAGIKNKFPDWKQNDIVVRNKTFSVSIKKDGIIYSVFLNGAKIFVGRYKDIKANNIRFASKSKFEINSITVESLQ